MKQRLTDARCRSAKPKAHVYALGDDLSRGLRLRVTPAGAKTWSVSYRTRAGEQRTYTVGRFPDVTVAQAREAARRVMAERDLGDDPQAQLEQQRRDAQALTTVEQLLADYLEAKAGKLSDRTVEGYRSLGQRLTNLGDVRQLTRAAIRLRLAKVAREVGGTTANRAFQLLKALLFYAVEIEVIPANPMVRMERPADEGSRERTLTDDEVAKLWTALEGQREAPFFRLALLTAARRSELAAMKWDQLDLDAQPPVWSIPGEQRKGGKAHAVPLSPLAVKILRGMERRGERVFEGVVNAHNLIRVMRPLRGALGFSDWTLHDLRRTCATGCSKLGISNEIVSRLLGHASIGLRVTAIYQRYDRLDQVASAVNAWGTHVERLVSGRRGEVVAFNRA